MAENSEAGNRSKQVTNVARSVTIVYQATVMYTNVAFSLYTDILRRVCLVLLWGVLSIIILGPIARQMLCREVSLHLNSVLR